MKAFWNEFKEFIARGNVLSMAVGLIVGSAFTAIVTSLNQDIITPLLGLILGQIDFAALVVHGGRRHRGLRQVHPGRDHFPNHGAHAVPAASKA